MNTFGPPPHPVIQHALRLARAWCAGHRIDDGPAIIHAVRVARTLLLHVPDAAAPWIAACLLHDAPEYAPADVDLDATLTAIDPDLAGLVRGFEAHRDPRALGRQPPLDDDGLLFALVADKIVALTALDRRAAASADPAGFWGDRPVLRDLMPYFREFTNAAAPHLPPGMAAALDHAVERTDRLTRHAALLTLHGGRGPTPGPGSTP